MQARNKSAATPRREAGYAAGRVALLECCRKDACNRRVAICASRLVLPQGVEP